MKALRDMTVLTGRSMRHILRSPDTIITVAIMPIAFMLLFVYVFGGAISAGSGRYVNYLLPGILLIAIASGTPTPAFAFSSTARRGSSHDSTPCPYRGQRHCGDMC